jgi:hypothetical protein
MPGSVADPVQLDHFQNIVSVRWPSRVARYVTIDTGLVFGITDESFRAQFGTYTGIGVPAGGGSYIGSYFTQVRRAYFDGPVSYEGAGGFVFSGAFDENGNFLSSDTQIASVSGHPTLPADIPLGPDYSSGAAPIFGPQVSSPPTHELVETGTENLTIPNSPAGFWKAGGLTSKITAYTFGGAADDYNPDYPTPQGLYARTRPLSGTSVLFDSLSINPTSVVFESRSYEPIGAHSFGFVVSGLGGFLKGRIICRRTS